MVSLMGWLHTLAAAVSAACSGTSLVYAGKYSVEYCPSEQAKEMFSCILLNMLEQVCADVTC